MEGKTCIVTGGGSGIGRATCLAFAQRKVNVVVVDVSEDAGRETEKMIKQNGGTACFVQCDVSNEQGTLCGEHLCACVFVACVCVYVCACEAGDWWQVFVNCSFTDVINMVKCAVNTYGSKFIAADMACSFSNFVLAGLDFAHNNAGIEGERAPVHEIDVNNFDIVMQVRCCP